MRKILCGLVLSILFCGTNGWAQAQPCPNTTLANVLGNTCTIGPITFNFGTTFSGFAQTTNSDNVLATTFFGPDAIGFVPVTSGTQSGFQLVPNFVANTNGTGLFFSGFDANFSYGVKANDTSEVVSETATLDGNITQIFTDSISAFDEHQFKNQSLVQVAPTESFFSFSVFSQPTATTVLTIPGVTADGADPSGLGFTTQVNAFAFSGDEATLRSVTFLYTTAPRVPTPAAGNFQFQNIDLPGVQSTSAVGINDHDQIVGSFQDASGVIHGYITEGADFRTIDFPNASGTFPSSINDSGVVAGAYTDEFGQAHGFILEDGAFTSVDFPGATFTSILQINDQGDLAGVYVLPGDFGGSVHGFIRDQNGFTNLDDPSNTFFIPFTQAFGINDRENAIGTFLDTNGDPHGFSFFHGAFQSIDVPGAGTTSPEGLNDNNSMVGIYTDLDGVQHGYLQRGAAFSTLDFPAAIGSTFPIQINNNGTIVGAYTDDQGLTHSFTAELQPGGTGQENRAANSQPEKSNSTESCSVAEWAHHPEKMRNPRTCHLTSH